MVADVSVLHCCLTRAHFSRSDNRGLSDGSNGVPQNDGLFI